MWHLGTIQQNNFFFIKYYLETRGWMHQRAHLGAILSNSKPDTCVGRGGWGLLLPGSCWSLRCFPSAILASLRWNLEQSSALAEMKIKCAELQQKICARRLKRHQSAKPHLGWTHFWLFIVLKEKAKTTRGKRGGPLASLLEFRICSYLSGWL